MKLGLWVLEEKSKIMYNNYRLANRERFNNFQRQETARWLLNISQAVVVGGAGSLFIPGVSDKVGIEGAIASLILAISLYILSMYIGRKVKDVK